MIIKNYRTNNDFKLQCINHTTTQDQRVYMIIKNYRTNNDFKLQCINHTTTQKILTIL